MNQFPSSTVAVVSTLNEHTSIAYLVTGLRKSGLQVVVVDAASSDDTVRKARDAGAEVIALKSRPGLGRNLTIGWSAALDMGAKTIVQMDAGWSHMIVDALSVAAQTALSDVVVGSRFCLGGKYFGDPKRKTISQAATAACNLRFRGQRHTDWTSGLRAFRAPAAWKLAKVPYSAKMHDWQIEVLLVAHHLELSITDCPIVYHGGRSSFSPSVAKEAFKLWLKPDTQGWPSPF
jgi:dolichol-phosphate mannosyltransferase